MPWVAINAMMMIQIYNIHLGETTYCNSKEMICSATKVFIRRLNTMASHPRPFLHYSMSDNKDSIPLFSTNMSMTASFSFIRLLS